MRHGIVILPQEPWTTAREKWESAESLGFDHAWTYDHLSWRTLADQVWHATVPTLTAAAVVTKTIRLGTFVASPNFRHPVPFAKEVATLDDISDGRFVLGVGSGGTGFDAFVLGQPEYSPRERHERYVEFVAVLDELLRHEPPGSAGFDVKGRWFTARGARMVGEPVQRPRMPFVLAANGPKGLALVAERAQGWVTTGWEGRTGEEWWQSVEMLSHRLDDALENVGRDPRSIDRYLSLDSGGFFSFESVARFDEMVERAEALGFTDVISHWPRADGIYAGDEHVLRTVAARFAAAR
ncbi:alkanesulfonate monooxygenase SsuD/methylene tetrahydromethanopterin reductase-like flavin-dependent oxidoreductase (luciferase family) [Microbacterium sp. AG1240]|uniref:LLM class flavin-dependent oxidoreductase n=1 Tax=Microbacterium sp. AG1240 TaxID=2183992 RepID=UPI000EAC9609|nr:LLM class flavin-dependent oxidoreductase [Microbacterium sp. AG1240]RKT36901.1 alkanesulfonate monooxygenase SsuD/methylene tetrahydromethanopterin reductase-like flavin-dependent oxidoreductase (luciferase family) [Microbacterium sp. AG1240]